MKITKISQFAPLHSIVNTRRQNNKNTQNPIMQNTTTRSNFAYQDFNISFSGRTPENFYAQIVVMNKEEASMATGIQLRSDTKEEKFSEMLVHPDLKAMFKKLKVSDYQVIVITDGGSGAYAYDGKKYYYCCGAFSL